MVDDGPKVAGVILKAADTGRILVLQRGLDPTDPASGMIEAPGGHLEDGEHPLQGAMREFCEEVGHQVPAGARLADQWDSTNGVYRTHVLVTPSEGDIDINLPPGDRHVPNPDDPDGDKIEVVFWVDPDQLRANPMVRTEMRGTRWQRIEQASADGKKALVATPYALHYRRSFNATERCPTCVHDQAGFCEILTIQVAPEMVCDQWTPTAKGRQRPRRPRAVSVKWDPDQPRDDHGRFGDGGGGVATLERTTRVAPHDLDGLLTRWSKGSDPVEMQHVQVTGAGNENLFSRSSLNLPREAMPVIPSTGDAIDRFKQMLDDRGIGSKLEQVDPRTLTATQGQLDGQKVGYLYQRLKDTGGNDQRVIVADRDGNILDGHHRWAANAAYTVRDPSHKVPVLRADTDIHHLLDLGRAFSKSNGIESRAFGEYGDYPKAGKGRLASDADDDAEFRAQQRRWTVKAAASKPPHPSRSQYREPGGAFGKEPKPPKHPFRDPNKEPGDPRPDGAPRVRGGWPVTHTAFVEQHPEAEAWVRKGDTIHRFPDDGYVEVTHLDGTWTQFHPKPDGKLHVTRRYEPPPPDPQEDQGARPVGAGIKPKAKVLYRPSFPAEPFDPSQLVEFVRAEVKTDAPYYIRELAKPDKDGNRFVVVNHEGVVKAKFEAHAAALSYQRALMVNVSGAAAAAERAHGHTPTSVSRHGKPASKKGLPVSEVKFAPDQERDDHGRFAGGAAMTGVLDRVRADPTTATPGTVGRIDRSDDPRPLVGAASAMLTAGLHPGPSTVGVTQRSAQGPEGEGPLVAATRTVYSADRDGPAPAAPGYAPASRYGMSVADGGVMTDPKVWSLKSDDAEKRVWSRLDPTEVNPQGLIATRPFLNEAAVAAKASSSDVPKVYVDRYGRGIVIDGHHTVAANNAAGRTSMRARVFDSRAIPRKQWDQIEAKAAAVASGWVRDVDTKTWLQVKYNPDQPRDDHGRFGSGGESPPVAGQPRKGMGDIPINAKMLADLRRPAIAGGGPSTASRHLTGDGRFSPERQALHDRIVRAALAGTTPVANPRLIMMGGGPASGKSTMKDSGLVNLPTNAVQVDPDGLKEQLPETAASRAAGNPNWASEAHEESSYLGARIQAAALETGRNVVLDTTGDSSADKLGSKVDAAHAAGFKVTGNYVTVHPDEAVRRATVRAERTGRVVPEEVIRDTHAGISRVLPAVADKFDAVHLYDTNVAQGSPPVLIASKEDGEPALRVLDQAKYDRFLSYARA